MEDLRVQGGQESMIRHFQYQRQWNQGYMIRFSWKTLPIVGGQDRRVKEGGGAIDIKPKIEGGDGGISTQGPWRQHDIWLVDMDKMIRIRRKRKMAELNQKRNQNQNPD